MRGTPRRLLQTAGLPESGFPVLGQFVLGFFGRSFAADDEAVPALVGRSEEFGIFGDRPEILDDQHRLVERLVVRRGLAEGVRLQDRGAARVAAQFAPTLLHVVAHEPLQELERLIALLGVGHDRDALPAQRGKALAGRALGHREVSGAARVFVGRGVRQRREEGEEVHAHRHQTLGEGLVRFEGEGLTPVRRREAIELLVQLESGDRFLGVRDPLHLVACVIPHLAAIAEDGIHYSHHQRVVGVVGVDGQAVALFLGPMEEFGDIAQIGPCLGHAQLIAVFGLERRFFFRILEPVLAIREAVGIALERNGPILAALAGIFGVAGHRRRRHQFGDLVLLEEVGQIDVVTRGRAGAEPLGVADHHVIGVALGGEFAECLGLEIRPRRGFDHHLDAGRLLVVLDQFLQVIRGIPFRPQDREFGLGLA